MISFIRKNRLFPLVLMAGLFSLGFQQNEKTLNIKNSADLNNPQITIACEDGTFAKKLAEKNFPKAHRVGIKTGTEMLTALQNGKIDAFVFDRPALEYMAAKCPQVMIMPGKLGDGKISIAISPGKRELLAPINEVIRTFRKNGTGEEMFNRWLKTVAPKNPAVPIPLNPKGKLVIGIEKEYIPFCFAGPDGSPIGYDVEYAQRLAAALELEAVFRSYEYEDLFTALSKGEIDIAVSQIDATAEREGNMLFSEPYIDSSIGIMIRKKDYACSGQEAGQRKE